MAHPRERSTSDPEGVSRASRLPAVDTARPLRAAPNALNPELMPTPDRPEGLGGLLARSSGRARHRREPTRGRASTATVAACVRRFCLECLGAPGARQAFDCLSRMCPLYVCMPFRGKSMPRHLAPAGRVAEAGGCCGQETTRPLKTRPSKARVAAYCRHCQPGDQTDCGGDDCALYPWRPWQPGGQPKARTVSEAQRRRLRVIGQSSQFRNPRQSTGTFEADFGSAGPGMGKDLRRGRRRR
jgi:hypothetical protein